MSDNRISNGPFWSDARVLDELRDYDPSLSLKHVEQIFLQARLLIERLQQRVKELEHDIEKAMANHSADLTAADEPFARRRPTLDESNSWSCEEERDWWRDYALEIEERASKEPSRTRGAVQPKSQRFECISIGEYDDTMKCTTCKFTYMESADASFDENKRRSQHRCTEHL